MNQVLIRIHVKSYHYKYCLNFLKTFEKIQNKIPLTFTNKTISYMPLKKKLYTILRSPHVNKKAREQFHLKQYKILISITLSNISPFIKQFFYILTLNAIGVSLKFDYILKSS